MEGGIKNTKLRVLGCVDFRSELNVRVGGVLYYVSHAIRNRLFMSSKKQKKVGVTSKNPKKTTGPVGGNMTAYALSEVGKRLGVLEAITHAPKAVDMKDAKSNLPIAIKHKLSAGFRGASRMNPYKTIVRESSIVTGAANTAYTTIKNLTPLGLGDAVSFSLVFDECRVTHVTIEMFVSGWDTAGNATAAAITFAIGGYAYDPVNTGAYANASDLLDASYHLGPVIIGNLTAQPLLSKRQKVRIPIPPVIDTVYSTALLGSNWVAASDTAIIVGYFKPYFQACGANRTVSVQLICSYEIEYAFRT